MTGRPLLTRQIQVASSRIPAQTSRHWRIHGDPGHEDRLRSWPAGLPELSISANRRHATGNGGEV
jgi:hypothetical protein